MYSSLLLLIICSSTIASDYLCRTPLLKIELFYSSDDAEILISGNQGHETIYYGRADYIRRDDDFTELNFSTSSNQNLEISFKTVSLESGADELFGFIKGYTGRGFLNQSVKCLKK
jgi:hypothetical protein